MDTPALPTALQPLQTLLDHATAERDQATAQLYLLVEQTRRLQAQREQLASYRSDYLARWTAQFRQTAAIEVVQSYQGFVDRLNAALGQLQGQIEFAEGQTQRAREALVHKETRVAAVRQLIERRMDERHRALALREQKSSDELATAAAWRAARGLGLAAAA